MSWLCFWF